MTNITTCKVLNQSNKIENEEIAVCTTWIDSKIKVLIIRNNNTMLMGEIFLQEFCIYAKTFDKTLEIYLKETEDILSGKSNEVEFFLDNHKFYWKKKIWVLGQLNVKIINELQCLKDFSLLIIDEYSKMKNNVVELERNNENLKCNNSKLINKLNELSALKEELEKKLYAKFILIINTKKEKIRELKSKLEKLESKDSIFDMITDESDNESNSNNMIIDYSNLMKESVNKRLSNDDDNNKQISKKSRQSETNLESVINIEKKTIESVKSDAELVIFKDNKSSKLDIEPMLFLGNNESRKSHIEPVIFEGNNESVKLEIEPVIFKGNNESIESDIKPMLFEGNNESIKSDIKPVIFKDNNESINSDVELMLCKGTISLISKLDEDAETPDLLSDESECEVELKFEEEKIEDASNYNLNTIFHEDSEEEMF